MSVRATPILLLLLATSRVATADDARTSADDGLVRLAFISGMLAVDREDVHVALHLWANELADILGADYRGESVIYDSAEDAIADVVAGDVTLITLTTPDYFAYHERMSLTPAMVPMQADGLVTERYALVVHTDSPHSSWEDLRGAEIAIGAPRGNPLPRMWMDVELGRRGLGPAPTHAHVRAMNEAGKAVLPVFFEQLDACVVTDRSLTTLAELNPQIGQRLRIIARSDELLDAFMSFGPGCDEDLRALMLKSIDDLHETVQGQQILELFGRARVLQFEEGYLQGVRQLVDEYQRLPQNASEAP